ncbi:MAG: hypothetical protein IJS54_01095 [Desulfovibrio sp.]|nr:hypothetical protein [Desulfovibrio sp.]
MLTLEWNMDDALQARFDENYELGYRKGYEVGYRKGYEVGYRKGFKIGIEFVTCNMLRSGMTFDKIQELTQLSLERIQELKDTLTK